MMHLEQVPWIVISIVTIWISFIFAYLVARWRQKARNMYIIPRVFVLCSPRTVQFHYELILRIGLPSYEFNPDRHDIDLTVLGVNNNEVVPMTRLNTKTLLDEPLITSLSLVIYRLVEMPQLGSIIVCHSGSYKAWVYAYDFTVINLSTNKEQYYTLNQYIGSINRGMALHEVQGPNKVFYPIDDVPLPHWNLEDIFLMLFLIANTILALNSSMNLRSCFYSQYTMSILFGTFVGLTIAIFISWYVHYNLHWDQDRKDFYNDYKSCRLIFVCGETSQRALLFVLALALGGYAIFASIHETDWQKSLIWFLVQTNTFTWIWGVLIISNHWDMGMALMSLGLGLQAVKTQFIGSSVKEVGSAESQVESVSRVDEDASSSMSIASRIGRSFGIRSSVKSYGFDLTGKLLASSQQV